MFSIRCAVKKVLSQKAVYKHSIWDHMLSLYWYVEFIRWRYKNSCHEVETREDVYAKVLESEITQFPIHYCEFGVFRGDSLKWWSRALESTEVVLWAFDSFEGLPEAWQNMPVKHFSTQGKLPDIEDDRIKYIKGLFHETVPKYLYSQSIMGKLIVHVDADLFNSTLVVLMHIMPLMKNGDILLFDEFHVVRDEFRAFILAAGALRKNFKAIARTPQWTQVAFKMVDTERD